MKFVRSAALFCALAPCLSAAATNLVTGNGFGFAVVSPETAAVTKFYAHPYSFARPDPKSPTGEGIETENFIENLRWTDPAAHETSAEYEEDSQIIHTRTSSGEGFFFMPFGFSRPALILTWASSVAATSSGGFEVEWKRPLLSRRTVHSSGVALQLLKFDGIEESLLLIPLDPQRRNVAMEQAPLAGHAAWALVSIENASELEQAARAFSKWRGSLATHALIKREIAELDRWRVKPSLQFEEEKERHLWRQSEVMLRMAQSREPNRPDRHGNGLIVASLPDGVWFTPWVRDMAWATVALARMGHRDEARAALLAYFNAQPTGKMRAQTGGADYQISVVRYFGDGAEEPFFTMEGNTNIEFDDWGEALWALGEYLNRYNDPALLATPTWRGTVYQSAKYYIVKPLFANLEKYNDGLIVSADTSIWEEHQKDKKHFAFSTAIDLKGLQDFAAIAHRAGDERTRTDILEHVALLERGFNAAFIRDGKLHGTLEDGIKNDIDGALLPIIHFSIVTDPAVIRDALERMELLKVASGGYRRVRSTYTDPTIFEYWYERQEFLFVDISLAEVLRSLGRTKEAASILQRITENAAIDHNIIPEMYVAVPCPLFPGQIGDPTSARPMVGYGAGAYILALLDRANGSG